MTMIDKIRAKKKVNVKFQHTIKQLYKIVAQHTTLDFVDNCSLH